MLKIKIECCTINSILHGRQGRYMEHTVPARLQIHISYLRCTGCSLNIVHFLALKNSFALRPFTFHPRYWRLYPS